MLAHAAFADVIPLNDSGTRPSDDLKTHEVAARFRAAFEALGLDLTDPNLRGTEYRVARAYRELFDGLHDEATDLRTFPNSEGYSQMVAVTGIPFHSLCAHHLLPFFGVAHVAYVPRERIVGLSKLARVVDFYARRPQVQERMTEEIVSFIDAELHPKGVMAVIEARHFCMDMRGVSKSGSETTTTASRGSFAEDGTRQEFLALLRRKDRTT